MKSVWIKILFYAPLIGTISCSNSIKKEEHQSTESNKIDSFSNNSEMNQKFLNSLSYEIRHWTKSSRIYPERSWDDIMRNYMFSEFSILQKGYGIEKCQDLEKKLKHQVKEHAGLDGTPQLFGHFHNFHIRYPSSGAQAT